VQQASDGDQHASTSLVVRFPDGTKQFRFPNQMPEAGDALWHDGERYRVISVSADGNGAWSSSRTRVPATILASEGVAIRE